MADTERAKEQDEAVRLQSINTHNVPTEMPLRRNGMDNSSAITLSSPALLPSKTGIKM